MARDPAHVIADPGPASSPRTELQLQRLIEVISRSQQGYRDLIDHLDQAVFTIALSGEILVGNVRLCDVLKTSFDGLIGRNIAEFLEEPTPEAIRKALPGFLKCGSWSGGISVRLAGTNSARYFDCWLDAITEQGVVTAVSGCARDITAQREAEIRSTELFESLQEGIITITPAGEILDANPALVRMLGYHKKEEILRLNCFQIHADPTRRDVIVGEVVAKGFANNQEMVLLRKDGSHLHCLASGFAVRDGAGQVVRIQATIADVTDQRELARQLHQEREFARRLIASFPDVIAVLDTEARFTYASENVHSVLGQPPASFIGMPISSICAADDQADLNRMLRGVLSGAAVRDQVECHMTRHDSLRRTVRITAAPLLDEAGATTGVVAAIRDVTESNLVDQEEAKKEKFTAMGQMLAGAAHELNNPLTAILGISDLLRESSSDEAARRQAELILKQARRAASIVQNLLAFSRPLSDVHLPLKMDDVIRQALLSLDASLRQKNIKAQVDVEPGLALVQGDRRLLLQVFSNLIVNAEQAISAAHESGAIRISLKNAADRVCLSFHNDGPAIPPENLTKLFDPFFTTKRPGGGSGLGLTICLAVVKDHRGTIEVESPATGGATFRVYFPGVRPNSSPDTEAPPAAPVKPIFSPVSPSPSLQGRTVLVVDDEESIREVVQEGLSIRGVKVIGVSSGQEALEWLGKNSCDIVLCDFNMPGMKGGELFERVRSGANQRSGAKVPRFILMTGELVESSAISHLRDAGALTLQKPFHISAVADLLSSALS
jgi:PAS domain S-box-containing protein